MALFVNNKEREEFLSWLKDVIKETKQLKKEQLETLDKTSSAKVKYSDFDVTYRISRTEKEMEDNPDSTYYFLIVFIHNGHEVVLNDGVKLYNTPRIGLDGVYQLNISQTSFYEFYDYYYYQKNMTYEVSTKKAAQKVLNYFVDWAKKYFFDYIT